MQITISPKHQFMAMEAVSADWKKIVLLASFQTAITYAIAEMNQTARFSSEEMRAVNDFIRILSNLAEKEEPTQRRPNKSLSNPTTRGPQPGPKTERV